jgi:hypothetical protein
MAVEKKTHTVAEFVVGEDQTLTGGDVLSGFAVPVRNVFRNV